MAEKIRYEVEVDSSDAKRGLQDFSRAAKAAGKDAASALDDTASAGDKALAAIKQMADTMDAELRASAKAADALGQALGPELAGRVDLDKMVADFKRMGVSLEEVTADADKFADTLKQVDGIRLQQVNDGLDTTGQRMRTAGADTDKLSDSARGANSALANMLGNSAQDLGALGGVAGSAGVAIGQMAEYAADAALGGEALGASLKSMAAVAGPIAALSAGLLALQGILALVRRDDGLTAAEVAAVTEALADQIGILDEYQSAVTSAFGQGTADTIDVFTEAVFKSIEATKDDTFITNLETSLGRLGVVRRQFGEIAAQSQQDQAAWLADLLNLHGVVPSVAGDIADYYAGLSNGNQATVDWARNNPELAASFLTVSTALGEARRDNNAATQDFLDNQSSISDASKALVEAAIATAAAQAEATGTQFNWNLALQAYIELQQQILQIGGAAVAVSEQQTEAITATGEAIAAAKTELEDQTAAIADGIQAWKDHTMAVAEAQAAIADIIDQAPDLAGALTAGLDKVDNVFAGLKFDVDFKPAMDDALDALDGFKPDFQTLADEWSTILAGKPIDIFGNVRADDAKFLELTDNLRNLLQEGVVNEFEQGGKDAADSFLQSNAAQIAAASGLDIAEVYRIMGLPPDGSIDAIIAPTIAQDQADKAKGILDALAGVSGDPRIAALQIALLTDNVPADVAYAQSLLLAQDLGIPVTATVTSNADDVQDDIDTATEDRTTQVIVPKSDSLGAMQTIIDFVARDRTIQFITKADNAGATDRILDAVAAERDASIFARAANVFATDQILDNLAMPGGQARIATIQVNRVGGGGGGGGGGATPAPGVATSATTAAVHAPSAVTMSAAPTIVNNNSISIRAGVLGNHFDVERTVTRAMRRAARINGSRAVTP